MNIEHFWDVLEVVSDQAVLVEAEIFLLPTEQGGKHTPITEKYRPNHNFGDASSRVFYIGQVELRAGEFMFPGESRVLLVRFLDAVGLREKLFEGREWRIQEGSHLIGTGKVKYVV